MTFKAAVILMMMWLLGVVVLGVYRVGILVHVLVVAGLMLLLVAALKTLDPANGRDADPPPDKR